MTDSQTQSAKRSAIDRFLNIVEKGSNALPHPATLFAILALTEIVLSWVASQFSLMVQHPVTGAEIRPVNLLSVDGLHRILTELITNYTFALTTSCTSDICLEGIYDPSEVPTSDSVELSSLAGSSYLTFTCLPPAKRFVEG